MACRLKPEFIPIGREPQGAAERFHTLTRLPFSLFFRVCFFVGFAFARRWLRDDGFGTGFRVQGSGLGCLGRRCCVPSRTTPRPLPGLRASPARAPLRPPPPPARETTFTYLLRDVISIDLLIAGREQRLLSYCGTCVVLEPDVNQYWLRT